MCRTSAPRTSVNLMNRSPSRSRVRPSPNAGIPCLVHAAEERSERPLLEVEVGELRGPLLLTRLVIDNDRECVAVVTDASTHGVQRHIATEAAFAWLRAGKVGDRLIAEAVVVPAPVRPTRLAE